MASGGNSGDTLPPLREVIRAHGLGARKSFGQNFLLDMNLTRKIARAAGPLEHATLYEVGPGPGGLTRALLDEGAARVVAVERDPRCLPALAELSAYYPGRLEIHQGDALKVDELSLLPTENHLRIAANLPYNIGTALLVKWLTPEAWPPWWASMTLMFQKEVAERITSPSGRKTYGRLSVLSQWRASPSALFDITPRAFTPAPKVWSTLVRFEPSAPVVSGLSVRSLEKLTATVFGQKRKMLRRSLKGFGPKAIEILGELEIDARARPEELSVEDICRLAHALQESGLIQALPISARTRPVR
ncbi:MAG: 16S rRNA (adenine(1518)-N(6)/adenine(1519)-N(6))-dimethyltransferase RsmA [Proteobacteria bacterium]|nr:16S rRNA (adenine(1518)-N(6)/adenine(1519)-N(6))-dimethyltransferase RsmA [Pseudomonadota bacterium]